MKDVNRWRLWAILPFLCTGLVLGIALSLNPDPSGIGTHQQLGLEPCGFLTWAGYPCPMCGMTTTFSLFVHLHPISAVANQPFGAMLFLGTLYTFCLSFMEIVQPRGRLLRLWDTTIQYQERIGFGLLILLFLGWMYKIYILSP